MSTTGYENAGFEARWCHEQRKVVAEYLRSQGLTHGEIGEWPAWHSAPYIAIWAIQSLAKPGWIGWWAISGDLPTDYISSSDVERPQDPRKAMRVFARNWLELVGAWRDGREVENTELGDPASHRESGPLLEARAKLLIDFASDDSCWDEE